MTEALSKALRLFPSEDNLNGYLVFGTETFGYALNTIDNVSDALGGPQDPASPSLHIIPGHPVATSALTGGGPTDDGDVATVDSALAVPDIFADLSDRQADFFTASITHESSGSTGAVAALVPDGDVDYQVTTANSDGAELAASNGVATSVAFTPATSAPIPSILGSPTAPSVGSWIIETHPGQISAIAAVAHTPANSGVAAAVISVEPATPALAPIETASLANPAEGSSGANTNSSVASSGATPAQIKQALDESGLSVNGAGIKVGVLSDSFNDLGGAAADEANGALPPAADIDVIKDLASGGTDEGRAMMQIIHDIAPGASLAFYTAFDSEQDFANGILALAAAGSKVIVDDVSYFDEPFFQNGVIAQAIQTVEAEGVTYVSAAGNDAGNGYQAAWAPISGSFSLAGKNVSLTDAESFGGTPFQTVKINSEGTGDTVPLLLEWNQAYGTVSASTADLEMLVYNSSGQLVGTATDASNGESTNPWVAFNLPQTGTATETYYVAIENLHTGANPGLIKEITAGDGLPATISGANAGTVYGHAMTPGVITAGAVSAADTPAFGIKPALSESFSSSGARTELLFTNNGTALSSPDALSPVAVSGVDDISTTVPGGLSDFYGTSAASASLAGVAALILAADPELTPAQVEQIMEETALPIANSAVSGAGLVRVDAAVAAADLPLTEKVIQTDGSTSLVQVSNDYELDNMGSGSGPMLKLGGEPIVTGQFGAWVPFGAVQTSTGYDVAWEDPGTHQYNVWITNSQGNFVSQTGVVPGNSTVLESLETTFNQDLNSDGVIGVVRTVIQTDGSTSLVQRGNEYDFESTSGGAAPTLKIGGEPFVIGQFGAWVPFGAVQTATGYDVAWEDPGTNHYNVWSTDSKGNFISQTGVVPGNSTALETLELIFDQNLNGDGKLTTTVIQADTNSFGTTKFTEVADQVSSAYYLDGSSGSGPMLKLGGAPVVTGQFGAWVPFGAVQTSTGYDVAWEDPGTHQYNVWITNSQGNFVSQTGVVPGNSTVLESLETTFNQDLNNDGVIGVPATSTFSLQYKGFDYVAFYNGAYENSSSLPALVQTGANSIEATLDYGIDVATSQVVADPNYTDSLAALGSTIAQAEHLGLSVMVRPLIDFLNPAEIGTYTVGEWRQDYQPTNVAAFFASYQQMIVQEAKVAQANGAQMLSIGAELDQLTGTQYLSYWTEIITAVRQVFTGALTYSASWNTASEVSFWSQLNYEGIDNYIPLSNAQNPSLQTLVNGWLQPATEATNPGAYAVIGNQSPIQYFENLAAQSGKPLLFTELGYANDSGAAADPSASGNSPDPTLQAELYQAFFQAWTQSKSSALVGTYFWEWDPNGSTSNVGPNIDSFSPQNSAAQNAVTTGFETMSGTAGIQSASAKAASAVSDASDIHGAISQGALVKVGGPGNDAFIFHPRATANAESTDPQLGEVWLGTGSQSWAFLHEALTSPSLAHSQPTSNGHDLLVDPGHHSAGLMHAHIADLHSNAVFVH